MLFESALLNTAAFVAGIFLLVYSVEELVENISKAAVVTGISAFTLSVIFAGMDFENWFFGAAAMLGELPGVAFGSTLGSGMFLVGAAVAIAGFLSPFAFETRKEYLALLVLSPFVLLLTIFDGAVSLLDGVFLLVVFAAAVCYIYHKEKSLDLEVFRDDEAQEAVEEVDEDSKLKYLGLIAVYVIGIAVGSHLAVEGGKGVLSAFGLTQTFFGMTVVGLLMSLEEVMLVVEPVREGKESIAVGNIVGSLVFFATGNIGLLALFRDISLDVSVLNYYFPFFTAATFLTALVLYRGEIKKKEGVAFTLLYIAYWAGSILI